MKLGVALGLLLFALPSFAQERKSPEEMARIRAKSRYHAVEWSRPTLSLVPRVGIAAGDMGLTYSAAAELAYAPGMFDKRLAFALDLAWKPSSLENPFFNSYRVTLDELAAGASVTWHAYSSSAAIIPFVGAGIGASSRHATTTFPGVGVRHERELTPAGFVSAGVAMRLGAGAIEVEARARYSPSRTLVIQGSSNSPFSLMAGYRFSLL